MEASVWMQPHGAFAHASWSFVIDLKNIDVARLSHFLKQASRELKPDFGYLSLLTEPEIVFGRLNETVKKRNKQGTAFHLGVHTTTLNRYIPDLYWMTVFGAPYLKLFSQERLLAAPVEAAELVTDETVILQLSRQIEDARDGSKFWSLKQQVKTFLDRNAFVTVQAIDQVGTPRQKKCTGLWASDYCRHDEDEAITAGNSGKDLKPEIGRSRSVSS
jgi:hypothetical protein